MEDRRMTEKRLREKKREFEKAAEYFLGYPCNTALHTYKPLFDFLKFHLNNIGDPFIDPSFSMETREFEREVLRFFARLYGISDDAFWGYVTGGGTEGNMYGLFLGRELYSDSVLYFSADSHYSIMKIARLLNMRSVVIPSLPDGSMDLAQLEKKLREHRDTVPVFNLNIGTTMKGGVDDLDGVLALLKKLGIEDHYIHCDAALSGMLLPFLAGAPAIDFTKPIDSIAISGHKFIGSPLPCGVVLTRREHTEKIGRMIEYIGTKDTTITGSRSGFTPLILWYAIQKRGYIGFQKEARKCVANAEYLRKLLQDMRYPVQLNEYSNIVLLKRPSAMLVKKWQLASEGDWSHVVVMQQVVKKTLEAFCQRSAGGYEEQHRRT